MSADIALASIKDTAECLKIEGIFSAWFPVKAETLSGFGAEWKRLTDVEKNTLRVAIGKDKLGTMTY